MRQVAYKKNELAHNRGRAISVRENTADSETDTCIVKNFIYLITPVDHYSKDIPKPEIRIFKKIDSKSRREGFRFKIKGVIYVKKAAVCYQIRYAHSLNINIVWKTHVLVTGKPVALA